MGDSGNNGTLLGIAIVLLWLTGVCFWIAFTPATAGLTEEHSGPGSALGGLEQVIQRVTLT